MELNQRKNNRQIANWLIIGAIMIIIQIILGGITRLTDSGLSITEWEPVKGALPPMSESAWQAMFEKYQQTDQFKYLHQNFLLSDFKRIFFWEWFHRNWARLMGLVFIVGFIYFLVKKKFTKSMIKPMIILFVFGAMQGAIGWIMVASGLVPEKYYVGHVQLATHFIAAIFLLAYVLWFAFSLLPRFQQKIKIGSLRNWIIGLIILVSIQLIFGAFMAGLRAAISAPTWPTINGKMIPDSMGDLSPSWLNLTHSNIGVQFMHRGIAYLILLVTIVYLFVSFKQKNSRLNRWNLILIGIVMMQISLGIFTVINSTNKAALLFLGVAHQFVGMMLVVVLVGLLHISAKPKLNQRI